MILIYQSRDKRKRGKVNVKNIDVLRTIYDKNTNFFYILLCIVYKEGVILKHVNHRLKSEFIIDSAQAFCLHESYDVPHFINFSRYFWQCKLKPNNADGKSTCLKINFLNIT